MIGIFASTSVYYTNHINGLQNEYDQKVAKLEDMERQLILQEQKVEELRAAKELFEDTSNSAQTDLMALESEYETLRIEKNALDKAQRPFSKNLCKAVGTAGC